MEKDGLKSEEIRIVPEFNLGAPGLFADIRVETPAGEAYFVEVKYGFQSDRIARHLLRKYGVDTAVLKGAVKVILVADTKRRADWPDVQKRIEAGFRQGLKLEVWNEEQLLSLIRQRFSCNVDEVSEENIIELKEAIDRATGQYAFGREWKATGLQSMLLWHLSHWRIRQLREQHQLTARFILPPGMYNRVVVLMADLCSFSSYVRDTPDYSIAREALTAFYSKSRYAVMNAGGMMYQFVGDQIIGLFGIPEGQPGYLQSALDCAHVLVEIGESVTNEWQRQIDRVQTAKGVHISMALGDIQIVSLRPFGRAHFGAVSDEINMAARFVSQAGPSEIVVSNAFYQSLDEPAQGAFREMEPIEARHVGRISLWKKSCL
jgi:class 3 adenylate cyclase